MQRAHEVVVERDVDDAGHGDEAHGTLAVAKAAEDRGDDVVRRDERNTDKADREIGERALHGLLRCGHDGDDTPAQREQQCRQRKSQQHEERDRVADGRGGALFVAAAGGLRDADRRAHRKADEHDCEHVHHLRADGDGGRAGDALKLADDEEVGHAVERLQKVREQIRQRKGQNVAKDAASGEIVLHRKGLLISIAWSHHKLYNNCRVKRRFFCAEKVSLSRIAQCGGKHLPRGDDRALGVRELVRVHGAEHPQYADDVLERAAAGEHRRGDGAKTDLILTVFHGEARLAAGGERCEQRVCVRLRVGRVGRERHTGKESRRLALTHAGKDDLALRGAVQRQPSSRRGDDAKAVAPLGLVEGDDVPVFIGGEHGGGAGRFCQMLEVRPREGRDVPERAGAAAVFKKAQAEGVFAVCVLCDDVIVAHGGQKAEHSALGQPCALADGRERHRLARVAEELQKLDRLRHGADGVAVSHKSALPVKNRCLYYRSKISRNYWLFEPKCRNNAEITYTQRLQIASYFP